MEDVWEIITYDEIYACICRDSISLNNHNGTDVIATDKKDDQCQYAKLSEAELRQKVQDIFRKNYSKFLYGTPLLCHNYFTSFGFFNISGNVLLIKKTWYACCTIYHKTAVLSINHHNVNFIITVIYVQSSTILAIKIADDVLHNVGYFVALRR